MQFSTDHHAYPRYPHQQREAVRDVTAPAAYPVSVADMAAHLRLNDATESAMLADWIIAACDLFERSTGYCLVTRTIEQVDDYWPTCGVLYIPRDPIQSIDAVEYLDPAGDWQSLDDWTADLSSSVARVVLPITLPTLHPVTRPRIKITFTAGRDDGSDVPRLAIVAIKLLVAHWYANRELTGDKAAEIPKGWKAVCDQFGNQYRGSWNV